MKRLVVFAGVLLSLLVFAGCEDNTDENSRDTASKVSKHVANRATGYLPHNDVEFNNYNKAQKLYDSPETIIWCSTTWGNANAPIITVPVAGKLTSSSVSLLPSIKSATGGGDGQDFYTPEQRSVDGMYHGSPPPYRYGFTPGGNYVDFFNMPTLCTTALTKVQREQTKVVVALDEKAAAAQKTAEKALANGDKAGAQKALEGAIQ